MFISLPVIYHTHDYLIDKLEFFGKGHWLAETIGKSMPSLSLIYGRCHAVNTETRPQLSVSWQAWSGVIFSLAIVLFTSFRENYESISMQTLMFSAATGLLAGCMVGSHRFSSQ